MGFNAAIDIAGGGAGSSLSANGGKTDLNADYKGVGERSGIFAKESDLVVEGKGRFISGVFVTSEEAQANGNSNKAQAYYEQGNSDKFKHLIKESKKILGDDNVIIFKPQE